MLPCSGCTYRQSIPGDCHSRCAFNWAESPHPIPSTSSQRALQQGWFLFPFNYDPVWGPDECPAKSATADNVAKPNSRDELIAMLRLFS